MWYNMYIYIYMLIFHVILVGDFNMFQESFDIVMPTFLGWWFPMAGIFFHRYDESLPYLPWVNAKLEPVDMISVSRRMGHYLSALWPIIVVRLQNMFVVSVVSRCCLNVPMFNGCHIHVLGKFCNKPLILMEHPMSLLWLDQGSLHHDC